MDPPGNQAEKGTRRKLKRIVKKKAKAVHNASSTVAYYKKVKAALNASLNSSRARQTLQANNKALAQSLQQVKQELRNALNENARLKLENQDLSIKLLRVQNRERTSGEQSDLERRLRGLKMLLHQMSSHLLEVGTCINEGVDLCLLTPRSSQASTSRPASMEDFTAPEQRNSLDSAAGARETAEASRCSSDGLDTTVTESEYPVERAVFPEHDNGPLPLTLAAPDMSIILEQSVLQEEEQHPSVQPMEPVLEEPAGGAKKPSSISKLPQRVRNIASSSSSEEESEPSSRTSRSSAKKINLSHTNITDKADGSVACGQRAARRGTFSVETPAGATRRETFVVSKNTLALTGEETEGIESVEMPDLVSGLSASEEEHSPQPCQSVEQASEDGEAGKTQKSSPKVSQSNCDIDTQAETTSKKSDSAYVKHKTSVQKNDALPSSVKSTPAFKKPAYVAPPSKSKKNESGFFISNPCTLNLVHQRNTGSDEGCISSNVEKPVNRPPSVDQFLESIRDSNKRSRKLASLSPSAKDKQDEEQQREAMRTVKAQDSAVGKRLAADRDVADDTDHTIYFDADMELTEVLPPAQSLETMAEEGLEEAAESNKPLEPKDQSRQSAENGSGKRTRTKPRSKHARSKRAKSQDREDGESDSESNTLRGEDKTLAVAMRLGKPGQMVFAAARKEEDGTRKAIPAKPVPKARSKSKKCMEEMLKSLPQEEPKSVFDFHDRTPRQSEGKPRPGGSVFDISLDESCVGSVPSLASLREKLTVLSKEIEKDDADKVTSGKNTTSAKSTKGTSSTLLGDAPEYRLPLKGGDSDEKPAPKPRSRGRSASRGRSSQQQSRSKSRSRAEDGGDTDADENSEPQATRGRSQSRKKADDDDKDFEVKKSRGRSRSRKRESLRDVNQEDNVTTEEPRRSARSKSSTRKIYTEEDSSLDLDVSTTEKSESGSRSAVKERGRSRSRRKIENDDDDDEYQPSRPKSQARGRSRHRKGDPAEGGDNAEPESGSEAGSKDPASGPLPDLVLSDSADKEGRHHTGKKVTDSKEEGSENDSSGSRMEQEVLAKSGRKSRKSRSKTAKTAEDEEEPSATVSTAPSPSNPLFQVTQRRHRSKSAPRKLYSESDTDDAFGFLSEPDLNLGPAQTCEPEVPSVTVERRKSKRRTRSRGEALQKKAELDKESDGADRVENDGSVPSSEAADSAKSASTVSGQTDTGSEQAPVSSSEDTWIERESENTSDRVVTCSKDSGKTKSKSAHRASSSRIEDGGVAAKRSHSSSVNSANNSPVPAKKGRISSEAAHDNVTEHSVSSSATSHAHSKKSREKADVGDDNEAHHYQLQFEEVKKKLKQLDAECFQKDKVPPHPPAKKSRPLVLPTSTAVNKSSTSSKSLTSVASDNQEKARSSSSSRSKKGSKSQPGSPKDRKRAPKSQPGTPKAVKSQPDTLEDKKSAKSQPSTPEDKKSAKSLPGTPKGKSAKSQPRTPKEKPVKSKPEAPREKKSAAKSLSSTPASPVTSSARSSLQLADGHDESSQTEGRCRRRAAAGVSYKEPPLGKKLRRGDPFTTFLYKDDRLHIYKSPPKGLHRKHSKSGQLDRSALTDLTNMSIAEVETEAGADN